MCRSRQLLRGYPCNGYSLLELMLSLALGAILVASLLTLFESLQRHRLLIDHLLSLQVEADLGLTILLQDWRQSCGAGLLAGQGSASQKGAAAEAKKMSWLQLERNNGRGCEAYEYRYFAAQQTIKRRRLASRSRYSPLLANVMAMQLRFGIDTDGDCQLDRWITQVPTGSTLAIQQLWVSLQMQAWTGQWRQLMALPNVATTLVEDESITQIQVAGIWSVPDQRAHCVHH